MFMAAIPSSDTWGPHNPCLRGPPTLMGPLKVSPPSYSIYCAPAHMHSEPHLGLFGEAP